MNFNALDISASALQAQRMRMDTIASNIANVNTTRAPDGTHGVYRRKEAIFSSVYNHNMNQSKPLDDPKGLEGLLKGSVEENSVMISSGVKILQIAEDTRNPLKSIYNPSHPDAGTDGYVKLPNVNIVTEMVDMISASRAYEANVTTMNATKSMVSAAMKI